MTTPGVSEVSSKLIGLKAAGADRRATADVLFVDRADYDREAFAPHWAKSKSVQVFRQHDPLLGGASTPFAVAHIKDLGSEYRTDIEFLDTQHGREEYETLKQLTAAGVAQNVSMSFRRDQVAPVPNHLRDSTDRYVTKGELLELSFVLWGAVPGAAVTSVKCSRCAAAEKVAPKQPERAPAPPPRPADLTEWIPHWQQERVAARVLAAACKRWGIGKPVLKWFRANGRCSGQALLDRDPPEIWIRSGLDERQTGLCVGHESWHVKERLKWETPDEYVAERMAERLLHDMDDPRMAVFF
jgi:phage head maturation protease